KPFKISELEKNSIKQAGLHSLFRAGGSITYSTGDILNLQHEDSISNLNARISDVKTFKSLDKLSKEQKDELANLLDFSNFQELLDSKLYATENTLGSKINPEVFNY